MAWTAEEALIHHGILGQKWGRRNGPPYPLGASDHSAAEKNAGWRKSLNKDSDAAEDKSTSTDKWSRIIKSGTIAAGAALAAIGGVSLVKSGKLDKLSGLIKNGKEAAPRLLKLDLQFFAMTPSEFPSLGSDEVSPSEYSHVLSEVRTWATEKQKKSRVFTKAIGDFVYTIANDSDGDYRIIDKNPIPDAVTGLFERKGT